MESMGIQRDLWKQELSNLEPLPPLRWDIDPCEWALKESVWRSDLPQALCLEIGRRVLLAQLQQSEWTLRRVEKVSFERDRSVSRRIAVDLIVRDDAPVFVDKQEREYWLVPLTRLNRQTLVNFQLADEDGRTLTPAGIRIAQRLDQAVILAAAAARRPELAHDDDLRTWARLFIAGERPHVDDCIRAFEGGPSTMTLPDQLTSAPLFDFVVRRMQHAYTLYLFLPVDKGPKRLIQMTFDEPTNWAYQVPQLEQASNERPPNWKYVTGKRVHHLQPSHLLATFGLVPTRVRMQVPGAEMATSYHFEATAPPGVRIVSASLLAGRPNVENVHVSVDHVVGHQPTVGLHAIEVPPGSLCRVQLDLATRTRGLMTSLVLSGWFVFAVVGAVAYHWLKRSPSWSGDQIINIVLILVTTSAGSAALVAQESDRGIAARLVARTRAGAALAMTLPVIAAGFLVYNGPAPTHHQRIGLFCLSLIALLLALLSSGAWISARWHEKREVIRSPWDMSPQRAAEDGRRRRAHHRGTPEHVTPKDFHVANREYGFVTPAIGVRSAEAWLEAYSWTDAQQFAAIKALQTLRVAREDSKTHSPCPHYNLDRCSAAGTCAAPVVIPVRAAVNLAEPDGPSCDEQQSRPRSPLMQRSDR